MAVAGISGLACVQAQAVQLQSAQAQSVQAQEQGGTGEALREGPASLLSDRPAAADSAELPIAPEPAISHDDFLPQQSATPPAKPAAGQSSVPDAPKPNAGSNSDPNQAPEEEYGKQNKRILGIIPNYRAVSANTKLPPLDFKNELWLATQDTFDYSDFIFVGALASIDMASKSQPTFGQGAEGYGKYYWHVFVDSGVENYMAEAIVPAATREDPRYYTLGKGGFPKRVLYAFDRLFITRTNSGGSTFNLSEVVGAGGAAGIGNLYYPKEANTFVKTYQRWGTQVGLDGVFNVVKEFWPDINRKLFRGKY